MGVFGVWIKKPEDSSKADDIATAVSYSSERHEICTTERVSILTSQRQFIIDAIL